MLSQGNQRRVRDPADETDLLEVRTLATRIRYLLLMDRRATTSTSQLWNYPRRFFEIARVIPHAPVYPLTFRKKIFAKELRGYTRLERFFPPNEREEKEIRLRAEK